MERAQCVVWGYSTCLAFSRLKSDSQGGGKTHNIMKEIERKKGNNKGIPDNFLL